MLTANLESLAEAILECDSDDGGEAIAKLNTLPTLKKAIRKAVQEWAAKPADPIEKPKPKNITGKQRKEFHRNAPHALRILFHVTGKVQDIPMKPCEVSGLPAVEWWPDLEVLEAAGLAYTPNHSNQNLWRASWRQAFLEIEGRCRYCGTEIIPGMESIDHIHPTARGGDQHVLNLALTCRTCNQMKSDWTPEEWVKRLLGGVLR